jgi:hypothetical protein
LLLLLLLLLLLSLFSLPILNPASLHQVLVF